MNGGGGSDGRSRLAGTYRSSREPVKRGLVRIAVRQQRRGQVMNVLKLKPVFRARSLPCKQAFLPRELSSWCLGAFSGLVQSNERRGVEFSGNLSSVANNSLSGI